MLKKVIYGVVVCVLALSVLFLCLPGEEEHKISVSATVESVRISERSADHPIMTNEEDNIENFMAVSGLSREEVVDIINNPDKYMYIVCLVKVENKGDAKILLKEPSNDMFKKNDVWLLNEIDGYREIQPNTTVKTNVFLVAKNTAENKKFNSSVPLTVEYSEKIIFKEIHNSIIVWTQDEKK